MEDKHTNASTPPKTAVKGKEKRKGASQMVDVVDSLPDKGSGDGRIEGKVTGIGGGAISGILRAAARHQARAQTRAREGREAINFICRQNEGFFKEKIHVQTS